ncbi:transcription factor S-II-domain-containing protein [Armillaria luteobubalina]|uniref:DNA-directed RNA polymerase subunit n=1 Tax=Armillaria luteobubalina TaxID=153913 RepID=A0AA39Q1S6_9AGAR|nr:transcription factor S-II-domain-containing protein [Armillaria luteobubalina]
MILFCPSCANILIIGDADGKNRWVCQTCPYKFPINKQHTSRTLLDSKKVDDMRDVSSELSGGARTAYKCAKCGHGFSYFSQLQIRSADEPMTTFYKCVSCGNVRRED